MAATTDGGSATPGARPRRGRPSRFDLLAGVLRSFCRCGGAQGEAACAVCLISRAAFARAFFVHFQARAARGERASVRTLGNRAAAKTTAATFRELFEIADRKGLAVAWVARAAGVTRQTACNWKAGKGMSGYVARRRVYRLLDAVRRTREPVPIAEPPPQPPPMTPEERFWSRVHKSEGCWKWMGSRSPSGYGTMRWKRRSVYVHRVSLDIAGVPIPKGHWIVHACKNASCVRPDHLAVMTPKEAIRKHRRVWTPGGKARRRGG